MNEYMKNLTVQVVVLEAQKGTQINNCFSDALYYSAKHHVDVRMIFNTDFWNINYSDLVGCINKTEVANESE